MIRLRQSVASRPEAQVPRGMRDRNDPVRQESLLLTVEQNIAHCDFVYIAPLDYKRIARPDRRQHAPPRDSDANGAEGSQRFVHEFAFSIVHDARSIFISWAHEFFRFNLHPA
jgi:hypothetical protein